MPLRQDALTHKGSPLCSRGVLTAILIAGFALARTGAIYESTTLIFDSFALLAATKLVKAAVFVALALLFFWDVKSGECHEDRTRKLFPLAVVTLVVYCAVFFSGDIAGVTSFGFQILGLVMAGVSEALTVYLYAALMIRMPRGPELMLLGFAGTNAMGAILSTLSATSNAYLLLAFRVAGILVPAFALYCLKPSAADEPASVTARTVGNHPTGGTLSGRLATFVLACLFVNAVAGFYISIPSVGGVLLGGAEKSIIGILLLLADLAVYAAFFLYPGLSQRLECLYIPLALCLAGLLLMPLSSDAVGTRIGIATVRVGRDLFEVYSWVWTMHLVRRNPSVGRPLLCLVLAVSSFYFGAPFAKLLEESIAASELVFTRANVAIAIILALCVALIGIACRSKDGERAGGPEKSAAAVTNLSADDEVTAKLTDFDRRVVAMVHDLALDERETAVLIDTVHGFSGEAIGTRLGYSRDAVKFSLAKIYAKAGVSNKQELVEAIESWEPRG